MDELQAEWETLKTLPVGYSGRSYNDNVRDMDVFIGKVVASNTQLQAEVEELNKLADLSCEQRSEDANLIVQLQADVAELKKALENK